ncbi:MAG: hypothetical protein VYA60_04530 [Pseudomonadota bacterium]|nr:hypothetical protein [Pseudomonadota bacterium]
MSDKNFTVINWYHLGFLNPSIRKSVMIALTLVIAIPLIFYVVPFKYAIAVTGVWALFFATLLMVKKHFN